MGFCTLLHFSEPREGVLAAVLEGLRCGDVTTGPGMWVHALLHHNGLRYWPLALIRLDVVSQNDDVNAEAVNVAAVVTSLMLGAAPLCRALRGIIVGAVRIITIKLMQFGLC